MIIDHGTFALYTPDLPADDPRLVAKALFVRNASGVDWYAIAHAAVTPGHRFAMLVDGRVAAIDTDPSRLWPFDARIIETDQDVEVGQLLIDGIFVHPADVPPTSDDLKIYTAKRRWDRETGGIQFAGMMIPSDDRAKLLLMGAAMSMDDAGTAPFVVGATSVTLTGAQFKAAYAAIVAHVQQCFARQTEILAGIEAGTITTRTEIDAALWA